MFNPSEASECYFVMANPQRQIWFIPLRNRLSYKLIDSDEFFLPKPPLNSAAIGDRWSKATAGLAARS